jgi:glycosyltransferase involved in cell wall biosynthesis
MLEARFPFQLIKTAMQTSPTKPAILFTMRYPDDTGYVWNYIAGVRDRAAAQLEGQANCYMAFPRLSGNPSYHPQHMTPVELDCYDNSPAGIAAIVQFVKAHQVKVMVFMSALPQTVCLSALHSLGVRTLNTEDDSYDPTRRDNPAKRAVKFFVRRVLGRQQHDLHLANSAGQQQFLLDYQLLPPARVTLMKNSVDCAYFCPADRREAQAATGLDPSRFWILAVAQARSEKRIDQLIRVIHRVAQARPDARIGFVYVGDGPPVAQWKQLAVDLGVADLCVFAGRQNDVRPYFRAANMMVHAAERESFGLAIVEAMACGIPVVASAAVGPRETILDGHTGALIGLHDFDAFTEAILRYVDDVTLTELHGNNARTHVDQAYNVVRHGKEFAAHIARFL